jgi:phenylacetate-CoA ligase
MRSWNQLLYDRAPWAIRELLVALEARRRNRYRRWGDYEACKRAHRFEQYALLTPAEQREVQALRLARLLAEARSRSGFYRQRIPEACSGVSALGDVPVLTKADVREHAQRIVDPGYPEGHLWRGVTSGSTGTPLHFQVGREGIRARTAVQDNYYESRGCRYGEPRVRFGGSRIVPADVRTPPFWIYNRPDNQLQMSAYHIDRQSLPHYVRKLEEFGPRYVTGYAHAIYQVGRCLDEAGGLGSPPRALFTDSEGLPPEYREVVERGFRAPSYDVYGLGEVGWVAVQCRQYRYHVLDLTCVLEVVDEAGRQLPPGAPGRLVVTDLTQSAFPYIRYDTGDVGSLAPEACDCGMQSRVLERIEGRSDDLILTPGGRSVGRLSHVTKPGRGILESQIAQTGPDRVVIRVVPAPGFDPGSMEDVLRVAHALLGEDMRVDWELVESIPRTKLHKFKHVVREFTASRAGRESPATGASGEPWATGPGREPTGRGASGESTGPSREPTATDADRTSIPAGKT